MNKRNLRTSPKINIKENDDEDVVVSQKLLQSIQQKLEKSAALNGGFDRLIYKIDSIENNQGMIANKVDKIHDAIYDPDDGLFARINNNKSAHTEQITRVEKEISDMSNWRQQLEKSTEKSSDNTEVISDRISTVEVSIQELKKFREMTVALGRWILAAVGGGAITIIFKVLYDFVIIK
jgi:DNA repair ATPase RecN